MTTVAYDALESLVGHTLEPSAWMIVDQHRINQFADATGDHQWIHVDEAKAKEFLGSTIAHGFLTLSLLPKLGEEVFQVTGISRAINYGCNKVRFTNFVPVNSKVRLVQKVDAVAEKSGGKQMTSTCTIEIEGQDKPACVAETVTLLFP